MYPSIVIMNADTDVTSSFFDDKQTIYVTSIFRTIQGEGPFAGRPAIFVRLAGCNFGSKQNACSGCDTSFQLATAVQYLPCELIEAIDLIKEEQDIIVYTGGEPTLQLLLLDVMAHYSCSWTVQQIETNGTQPKFFKALQNRRDVDLHVCVSPKALIKANRYAELSPIVLEQANSIKFVVTADENSAHHTVPTWALALPIAVEVYVSPMAVYSKPYSGEVSSIWDEDLVNREATKTNYAYAAKYALANNLRLSLQTHLFVGIA